ncbi:Gfo/Idh/MocA family protein [Occallatibacter savannae]|uniref:Gfo/Idh/MocA family protein n=1 Tax=Occallatibacter savannae TaxID=1002691 RepID=UPI000D69CDD6|nr:Gfo/Idh/MocA family oxidoreductase [Occallatibacter savannae]
MNRREFLETASASACFTILPRHVVAGSGAIAPSDKITLAHIGTGTQGLREMPRLMGNPEIQVVAVCDPSKNAIGYRDWGKDDLLNQLRTVLDKPEWRSGTEGTVPGGRDAAKDFVDTYYANEKAAGGRNGCSSYADFRELLEKEKDVDAVKIMTPDHLHGVISIACMKRGKHVIMHKPIANRLHEAKMVIDTARQKKVATHFMPWESNGSMDQVMAWINGGAIGTLREIHNWSNRPVWPQYTTVPSAAPVPDGFDWDLWLGPEAERPYSPDYTHMVFRGWYDFGGGSMADMGHYSLWTVFNALDLKSPTSIEPAFTHVCGFKDGIAYQVQNDYSFPTASAVRFKYPACGGRPAVDLVWYDGGMRPPTPEELEKTNEELPVEGMMFVGSKGKILSGFQLEDPHLIGQGEMPKDAAGPAHGRGQQVAPSMRQWIAAVRGGAEQPASSFLNAWPISEAVNLYAVSLRTGKKLLYDAQSQKITNVPEANKYLAREYRKGWDPQAL